MKSFKDFMKERVKEYYSSTKIGRDFFTAPELDRAFGMALSDHLYQLIHDMSSPALLELGGGNGSLAYDILSTFKSKYPNIYPHLTYYIYESSPYLLALQKERLKEFEGKVFWTCELIPLEGVIFSNEFFDCLPVHVVKDGKELYVDNGKELWGPISDERISLFLERMNYKDKNHVIEVCLECLDFLKAISQHLLKGYHLLIDYGYTSNEMHRYVEGTVVGYKSHKVVKDIVKEAPPFDITVMVNFSAVVEYGKEVGLKTVYLNNLRDFLISSPSFLEELERLSLSQDSEDIERLSRLKTMLVSMGDRFKVLVQEKVSS
ncbi:SAM-dependent methyltransferase [Hydrogenobacter hydrogenophilus]|uniref:SAM-dependent methyltransferase, MidA family n=1 Tax=Hydrogenobacter hydrogenophilus TaxID=35835 RepID=A0A285NW72_9AQUI|nr:SAM-dependent methyltransferase [Hydrogenobacter hydrogenophilus]SNZ13734.1 SAM-dependent methyltransferase, MidA family [Hydrogenobacter hydrogenophilus]